MNYSNTQSWKINTIQKSVTQYSIKASSTSRKTATEVQVPAYATLLSATDKHGRITYANAAFCQISGFSKEQLQGQQHKIVRHPDMPKEAFSDLWTTIQAGYPWTALVKNRCNDGNYYWVRANVTPIERAGHVVGYMSVRTAVNQAETRAASSLYERFIVGKAQGFRFYKGLIVYTGWLSFLNWHQTLSVGARLRLALACVTACSFTVPAILVGPGMALSTFVSTGVCAALMNLWLQQRLVKPLKQTLAQAKTVAAGQVCFNTNLNRVDEIGLLSRAINQAGLNLRSLIDDVANQTQALHQSCGEVSNHNAHQLERATTTQTKLEDIAQSSKQISHTIETSAAHAKSACALALDAQHAAVEGRQSVERLRQSVDSMAALSTEISEINQLINSIAFQTNILALNAAVEAARAGETGHSFAVVAQEVRNLAQRTAEAANNIKALIEQNVQQTLTGSKLAAQTGEAIGDVLGKVERVNTLMSELSMNAQEQSKEVRQISVALDELEHITEQNSSLMRATSESAHALFGHTAQLNETIQVFAQAA